jgi:hypothetical protein
MLSPEEARRRLEQQKASEARVAQATNVINAWHKAGKCPANLILDNAHPKYNAEVALRNINRISAYLRAYENGIFSFSSLDAAIQNIPDLEYAPGPTASEIRAAEIERTRRFEEIEARKREEDRRANLAHMNHANRTPRGASPEEQQAEEIKKAAAYAEGARLLAEAIESAVVYFRMDGRQQSSGMHEGVDHKATAKFRGELRTLANSIKNPDGSHNPIAAYLLVREAIAGKADVDDSPFRGMSGGSTASPTHTSDSYRPDRRVPPIG